MGPEISLGSEILKWKSLVKYIVLGVIMNYTIYRMKLLVKKNVGLLIFAIFCGWGGCEKQKIVLYPTLFILGLVGLGCGFENLKSLVNFMFF